LPDAVQHENDVLGHDALPRRRSSHCRRLA
jgi:hypothetical protein